jgi:dipeptidyl aminopeptidase/acylaminoacyl peptidase
VVSRPNLEEDRYDSKLVLVDVATGAQRVLTFDRKDVGSPRWSPSGDRLAFLADNGLLVKFVAYPVAVHFPDDPVRYQDVYRRWLDWLDQYLK